MKLLNFVFAFILIFLLCRYFYLVSTNCDEKFVISNNEYFIKLAKMIEKECDKFSSEIKSKKNITIAESFWYFSDVRWLAYRLNILEVIIYTEKKCEQHKISKIVFNLPIGQNIFLMPCSYHNFVEYNFCGHQLHSQKNLEIMTLVIDKNMYYYRDDSIF